MQRAGSTGAARPGDDPSGSTAAVRASGGPGGWAILALGSVIAFLGLGFIVGGAILLRLGGSAYFLLVGIGLLGAGGLIIRRDGRGADLYGLCFVGTVVWAVWDAGLHFWPLVSRLYAPAVLLVFVLALSPLFSANGGKIGRLPVMLLLAVVLASLATATAGFFFPHDVVRGADRSRLFPVPPGKPTPEWRDYGGTTAGRRFAALDQINKQNIGRLAVAWTFRTGDVARPDLTDRSHTRGKPNSTSVSADTQDQNTPIQVGNSLYLCTPHNVVIAIEADTGWPIWRFDPRASAPGWQRCRGVAYHERLAHPENLAGIGCTARIFVATIDARLIALDARNGKPCPDFGVAGTVDLTHDLGAVKRGDYNVTAAPLVAGDRVVIGGRVVDNQGFDVPGGVVRAFDVTSGSLVWAFDSGNPAITTVPPPGQSYSRGSPNVWSTLAYDPKLQLIYLPTAAPAPDRSGKRRTALDEAYGSSVVALDARSGRPRWKFQTVHHDLWDYDVPSQPLLIDLPDQHGRKQPALVQTTKAGQIFVLNRVSGSPIARVEERPVPRSGAAGERLARTQPFSVGMPQIGMATLRESDMWGVTPIDQLLCRIAFRRMRYAGPFTPPGRDVSLSYPGPLGGMNWGSAAVEEGNHILVVNDIRIGYWLRLGAESSTSNTGKFPVFEDRFLSVLGLPCQAPPYGTLSGIDLVNGELLWQIPTGTVENYKVRKIRLGLPIPIGMPTLGGPMVTQAGLVFFAGAEDHYLRALDVGTGRERWKGRLPVGAQATPMTYVSPRSGRQYVVISAGGTRTSSDRGDYVVAFALR